MSIISLRGVLKRAAGLFEAGGAKAPAADLQAVEQLTASLFTGARPTAWKSKPQALEAIRNKFEERVYLAGKAALNENVTPW